MTQILNSKEVIDSIESIISNLEKLHSKSRANEKLHKGYKQYSFMRYHEGAAHAYSESFCLLKSWLYRLVIEK